MNRRQVLQSLGVSVVAGLSGCIRGGFGPDWNHRKAHSAMRLEITGSSPTFAVNTKRTGTTEEPVPESRPKPAWKYWTGRRVPSTPAVANGSVFAASLDHAIYALNTATGDLLWRVETGLDVAASPTVVDGIVYIGSMDGKMYAIDAESGEIVWTRTLGGMVSSAAVVNDTVYVGDLNGNVTALDAATGTFQWQFKTGEAIFASPAVSNSRVFVPSYDLHLYALDVTTGELDWSYQVDEFLHTAPAVGHGYVFFGRRSLTAVEAETGAKRWKTSPLGNTGSSPAVTEEHVITGKESLHAFYFDGTRAWTAEVSCSEPCSPIVSGSTVIVPTEQGVTAVSLDEGTIRWQSELKDFIESDLAVADGTIFLGVSEPDGGILSLHN